MGINPSSVLNVWDGAHMIELAIGDVFNGSVCSGFRGVNVVSKTITTLGKIACFMSFGEKNRKMIKMINPFPNAVQRQQRYLTPTEIRILCIMSSYQLFLGFMFDIVMFVYLANVIHLTGKAYESR